MKIWKRLAAGTFALCGFAVCSLVAMPSAAWAGTPEFARSEEEWERLRDDNIEYAELPDLIHEYNATAKKNQIDLNEFRKDYGETNDEWADRYRELADDLEASLDYPDVDDSGYATAMSNIVTSEMQIDEWRETADDALEDYMTYYYDTCLAECLLVSEAQSDMIGWYQEKLQLETDEESLRLLQEQYENAVTRQTLGMATEADVLAARESVRSAEKTVQDDKDALENLHQRMMVLLGRSHDDTPQIGEIPEVDPERIAAMDPELDKAAAIENSYTMKSNKRKLENSKSQDTKDNLLETIREDEQNIGASLRASYQDVLACQASYELSVSQAELEQNNLRKATLQYELGNLSRLDYVAQQITTQKALGTVQTARLQLFQAVQSYDWALNGLAGTSAS